MHHDISNIQKVIELGTFSKFDLQYLFYCIRSPWTTRIYIFTLDIHPNPYKRSVGTYYCITTADHNEFRIFPS
jgi:hypothetical protein